MDFMDSLKDEVLHLQHGLCWSRYWLGAQLLFAEAQQAGRGPALCYESFSVPMSHTAAFPWDFFTTCSWTGSLLSLCMAM